MEGPKGRQGQDIQRLRFCFGVPLIHPTGDLAPPTLIGSPALSRGTNSLWKLHDQRPSWFSVSHSFAGRQRALLKGAASLGGPLLSPKAGPQATPARTPLQIAEPKSSGC